MKRRLAEVLVPEVGDRVEWSQWYLGEDAPRGGDGVIVGCPAETMESVRYRVESTSGEVLYLLPNEFKVIE